MSASQQDPGPDPVGILSLLAFLQLAEPLAGSDGQRLRIPAAASFKLSRALSNSGLHIHGFDYHEWWNAGGDRFATDLDALASADFTTIRRLLTFHSRGARFGDDYYEGLCENGHMAALLARLARLVADGLVADDAGSDLADRLARARSEGPYVAPELTAEDYAAAERGPFKVVSKGAGSTLGQVLVERRGESRKVGGESNGEG